MAGLVFSRQPAWVPFAYGFRPFFLLAGLYAALSMAAWLWVFDAGAWPLPAVLPQLWHGHEMIFGLVGAAIAGFLLTAVPSWTGDRGFAGAPLIILALLWLAGRAAFLAGSDLLLLAIAELAFIPALALTLAPSLLRSANRNRPLLVVLAVFWSADACFVYALFKGDSALGRTALLAALDLVLLLITVIGGRIVPAFTGNALRNAGVDVSLRSNRYVERLVIAAMIACILVDVVAPASTSTAAVAGAAAALQFWRLSGWQGWRTGSQPIVWVLHLAYLWLPVGLGLKAAWLAGGVTWAAHWQHALGAGAAGMMILAVMTRASLGHTGRPLRVSRFIALAYGLLALSVAVRVFGPALLPFGYTAIVLLAGGPWIAAWLLYIAVYAPILVRPRADGAPG